MDFVGDALVDALSGNSVDEASVVSWMKERCRTEGQEADLYRQYCKSGRRSTNDSRGALGKCDSCRDKNGC